MSFYKKPKPSPAAAPTYSPPKVTLTRGDRMMAARLSEPVPDHRIPAETLEGKGKIGLTNARVLDREPRGCLFKVKGGFFDLDGYWVRIMGGWRNGKHGGGKSYEYEVRRGAPRAVNRLLSKEQRRELERVRLQARRKGVR